MLTAHNFTQLSEDLVIIHRNEQILAKGELQVSQEERGVAQEGLFREIASMVASKYVYTS